MCLFTNTLRGTARRLSSCLECTQQAALLPRFTKKRCYLAAAKLVISTHYFSQFEEFPSSVIFSNHLEKKENEMGLRKRYKYGKRGRREIKKRDGKGNKRNGGRGKGRWREREKEIERDLDGKRAQRKNNRNERKRDREHPLVIT